MSQISCRACGREIPAQNVNLSTVLAKCDYCNAVFSFAENVGIASRPVSPRGAIEQPRKITVDEWGSRLTIRRSWFSAALFFMAAFCCFWDGFLVVWYSIAIANRGPILMLVFPVLHVAVGVGLTYAVLAGFLNRTTIVVDGGQLTVRHGPLPWKGNISAPTHDIRQFFCVEEHAKSRRSADTFAVIALTQDDTQFPVVRGLDDPNHALFIEQTLERHLGLRDEHVAGEYGR